MKYIIFISLILLFSCNNNNEKDNIIKKIEEKEIIGIWLLVDIDGLQCNVCPRVIFFNNSSGKIIKPSKEEYFFDWNLINKNIILFEFHNEVDKSNYFSDDTVFYYNILNKGNSIQLILETKEKGSKYILSKSKNKTIKN